MFPSLARILLFGLAALLILIGGAAMAMHGGGLGAVILGVILLVGALYERWRYKPVEPAAPIAGFESTPERFLDPVSRRPVRVYIDPTTGERRYVDDPGP